jgi:predicted phosphate transport protein (TIGR00153 family)
MDRKVERMVRRLFGWIAPKRGEDVLKMVKDHLELTKNAVSSLYRLVESVSEERDDIKQLYDSVSDLEMEADDLRRKMVDELTKGEMFPEERGDLMELVRAVDWIADWSKEAGRILIIIPFQKAPEEMKKAAQDMCRANLDCVTVLAKCIHELYNKNSKEAINLANQVELLEEELDELYSIARRHLATMEFPEFSTGALILLNMFLDALETVADWCENTADIVRAVAVRIQ